MRKFSRDVGCGSGTVHGYRVEGRTKDLPCMANAPIKISSGQTLFSEWQEIDFTIGNPAGVPLVGDSMFPVGQSERLMPYESATALAWTVLAQNPHRVIEMRIVRYTIKYTKTMQYDGFVDGSLISHSWFPDVKIVDDVPPVEVKPDGL